MRENDFIAYGMFMDMMVDYSHSLFLVSDAILSKVSSDIIMRAANHSR